MLFTLLHQISISQTNNTTLKECRITAGVGIGDGTGTSISAGVNSWLQLSYKLNNQVSVATEFESIIYKKPGYFKDLTVTPNEMIVYNNNFSLLLKYQLALKSPIKIAVASGWTYAVRQTDYYQFTSYSNGFSFSRSVTSFSDYRIPFVLEVEYPITKTINIQARGKYNLDYPNGSTYSTGMGLSLKL